MTLTILDSIDGDATEEVPQFLRSRTLFVRSEIRDSLAKLRP